MKVKRQNYTNPLLLTLVLVITVFVTLLVFKSKDTVIVYTNDYELLRKNGYNVIETKITIANPGSLGAGLSDTIMLNMDKEGHIYHVELGDMNISVPCKDERTTMIENAGGTHQAASNGISSTLKGCTK